MALFSFVYIEAFFYKSSKQNFVLERHLQAILALILINLSHEVLPLFFYYAHWFPQPTNNCHYLALVPLLRLVSG